MRESINGYWTNNTKASPGSSIKSQLKYTLFPSFSIPDEMVNEAKSLNNIKYFMIINDKYILIKDGKSLIWDIEKCNRLREKWVNYCGPVSYREVGWDYYFIEHKAPWVQLQFYDYDRDTPYTEAFKKYLSYLELLANATQEQYNKFFDDIELMKKESLKPDCCSLWNLFFDSETWFNFIDVYPCNIHPNDSKLSVSNIFKIILNPKFSYQSCNVIPSEELDKYNELIKIIYGKILTSLRSHQYPEDEIIEFLNKKMHFFSDKDCIEYKDIEKYIKEHYNPYVITI